MFIFSHLGFVFFTTIITGSFLELVIASGRCFVRARLFIQRLREGIFLTVEGDTFVSVLGLDLTVDDPSEGEEENSSKDDQKKFEHRLVLDDFSTGLILSRSLQVGEGAS